MDPQTQFCHNPACPARGKAGERHIVIHSQKEQRYRCKVCEQTLRQAQGRLFAATKGTPFFRVHQAAEVVTIIVSL